MYMYLFMYVIFPCCVSLQNGLTLSESTTMISWREMQRRDLMVYLLLQCAIIHLALMILVCGVRFLSQMYSPTHY